ncbi:MAG: polyphosphate kinase 1 [Actinomycetota bacterium]
MASSDDEPITSRPERFINRELSWLAFNSRVLAQAEDDSVPLLERLKFCAIYASNLDEFFQVRVAGLKEQVAAGVTKAPPDGLSPLAQLAAIRDEVRVQAWRLEWVHSEELMPALAEADVHVLDLEDLNRDERKKVKTEFENRIFPILTPLAVDPSHPFPYISNLSLSLAVLVDDPDEAGFRFARLKVPPSLPRFIELGPNRFVPIEQVIIAHLDQLFPGMTVRGGWPFRVTRNADMTLDDEDADDLLEMIELELRRRRFGRAIRLELDQSMPLEAQELLVRELDLEADDVYLYNGLLDHTGYWQLMGLDRSDLKVDSAPAVTPRRLRDIEDSRDFFSRLRRADVVVHHPYESFSASVSEFIRQASLDPGVLAIKLTLYRTSGDSPIIDSLIRAAEAGKQVAALVEIKARFDEEANIEWARRLEEAGVHVVYGLVGLKIHTKTALVVRSEGDGIRRYCHVGTGNYNPKTARIYEDIGVLTADADVGNDLTQLFNYLTGYGRDVEYERLLVAPHSLRRPLEELIRGEMVAPAGTGRIVLKMNSLVDAPLIDLLYEASQAGVQVDLIVRGICCLRAGVPGLSENITVRSLVGRFLEHSRIYCFGNGGGVGVPAYYIGSADLMPRNLDRRVEVVIRVDDITGQERLAEVLTVNLTDTALAWELGDDDVYHRLGGEVNAHVEFERLALERAMPPEPVRPQPVRPPSPPVEYAIDAGRSPDPDAGAGGSPFRPPIERPRAERPAAPAAPAAADTNVAAANTPSTSGAAPADPAAAASFAGSPSAGTPPRPPGPARALRPVAGDPPIPGATGPATTTASPVSTATTPIKGPATPGQAGPAAVTGGDEPIAAAGCVVYRLGAERVEVLLAHRPGYDDWSFPKGKRDDGETDLECALRELEEETGFRGRVVEEMESAHYEVGGRPKTVRYWLLELSGGQFQPNDEVDKIRWLPVNEAVEILSYQHDRLLLDDVPTDPPTPTATEG